MNENEYAKMQDKSRALNSAKPSRKRFSISSRVIPGLVITLDSLVIVAAALISYSATVNFAEFSYYAAAIAFVWLVSVMLINFSGLYEFDVITRPIAFIDKILIVFVTTFSFLL